MPSVQGLGQQQLRVGKGEAEASIQNAMSEVEAFGLKKDSAIAVVRSNASVVAGWKEFFRGYGVLERDLETLAQYIDGPNLKAQRYEY